MINKTIVKHNSLSQSSSNISPFPKLKPRGSININPRPKKEENENIFHKSTYNSNLRNNENDFLSKIRTFDPNLPKETENRIKNNIEKRKIEEKERKKREKEEKMKKEEKEKKKKEEEEERKKREEEEKKKKEEEEKMKKEEEEKKKKEEEEKMKKEEEEKKKKEEEEKVKKEEEEKMKKEEEEKKKKEEEKERKKRKEEEKMKKEEEEKRKKEEEEKMKKEEEEKRKKEEEEKMKKEEEEKRKKEEEEKRKKLLEEKNELLKLLERQKILRNEMGVKSAIEDKSNQQEIKNKKFKQTLEDMCIMGNIVKNQIIEEKRNTPDKFVSIQEAIQISQKPNPSKDDEAMLCLGILAQTLEDNGILTVIEKEGNQKEEDKQEEASTSLQFLVNGLINRCKYEFHFDLGEERNNELLINKKEQEKFNNKLKKKLSIEYKVPEDKIIITCPQKGSYSVQVIFLSEEFNNAIDPEQFKKSCINQEDFKELCYIKEIQKKVIMEGVKLSKNMLDYTGNQTPEGYGRGQIRGTYPYIPPLGWKGFGLKVLDKYDNGNNDWLKMDNNPKEWAIAYHGIGRASPDVEGITNKIIEGGFIKGSGQSLKDKDDDNHHGQKIKEGIYCSPDIKFIEQCNLAGKSKTEINGKKYKMAFMLRVKPDKIRFNNEYPNEWVLNEKTTDEIRPYRILLKEE